MLAHFHDAALVNDGNDVSIYDSRESMCHYDNGATSTLDESVDGGLHKGFRVRIQCAGGLIQEQNLWTLRKARERDSLLLTPRSASFRAHQPLSEIPLPAP